MAENHPHPTFENAKKRGFYAVFQGNLQEKLYLMYRSNPISNPYRLPEHPDHRVMLSLTPLALEEIAEQPDDCGCGKKARSRKKTTLIVQESK